MTRVLVTDGEQRSSLAVVRSLGAAGHDVAVCSARRRPVAGASRFCARTFAVPPPDLGGEPFVEAVSRAVAAFGAEVLLPMTDQSAPLLLGAAGALGGCMIPFPGAEEYGRISDKAHLMEEAAALGVPVPDQRVIESPGAVDPASLSELGLPLVLKPARSAVVAPGGTVRLSVRMAATLDEVKRALDAFPPEAYPILAQRRVVGPGLGVFLLAWDGRTLASFAHRRLREKPPTGGVSVYREGVAVRPDLLDYSARILERFRWRGVAMVEFKEDASTGRPYLMEVNGRFWGSLQLAVDSGVDFPGMLVQCATGSPPSSAPTPRLGLRSRWLWGEVDHLLAVLRASPADRQAHPAIPGRGEALARFLVPWRPGDRFEVLRLRDPVPFLAESLNWFAALRHG